MSTTQQTGALPSDKALEALAREHGTGGWQTLRDMVRFAKSAIALAAQAAPAVPALGVTGTAHRAAVDHAHELLRRLGYHRDGEHFVNVSRVGAEAIHVSTIATIVHAAMLTEAPKPQAASARRVRAEKELREALAEPAEAREPTCETIKAMEQAWHDISHDSTLTCEAKWLRFYRTVFASNPSQQATPARAVDAPPFQSRVRPWLLECFGAEIASDRVERNHRFLEEALELVQALGCTASEAHQLVDYVYGRPVGEPAQEVGGVMVTLAALCLANGLDMHEAGEAELSRIRAPELVAKIRAKQAAKPKHSPLPAAAIQRLLPDSRSGTGSTEVGE